MRWPSKTEREAWEIETFLDTYRRLPHGVSLTVCERRERPDFFVEEIGSGRRFGIELTSVYLNDRSVPDMHMNDHYDWVNPPRNEEELTNYEQRLITAVRTKVGAARTGYDLRYPLLLAVYVNEYISIHIDKERWQQFNEDNRDTFASMEPFSEVVFWNLPNQATYCVIGSREGPSSSGPSG